MPAIAWPPEISRDGDGAGGKATALAALTAARLPVPPWFLVKPGAPLEDLAAAVAALCPRGESLAVRSSALEEDGAHHSFAGQLESFLFVPPDQVAGRVARVRASANAERVQFYRRERGLPGPAAEPAVIVQHMIDADVSGVAFSADPVSGRRGVAVLAAIRGVGQPLVDGSWQGALFHVDRDERLLARPVDDALGEQRARDVARLARRAERLFGCPQDVEWAIAGGRLWILQSRPITTLAALSDPDGAPALWDNSNIVESYGGLVSPLTFSFARRAYEEVYRQFCRLMGVPPAALERNAATFRHMLGLIRGRVYYNLLNWYRVLALLPGYSVNRGFFEQMLGVRQTLSAPAPRLPAIRTAAGVLANYVLLPLRMRRFRRRLEEALRPTGPGDALLRPDELAACYRDLERKLLAHWDAPIVSDFFCMLFHGLLRRLAPRWCGAALDNDLLVAGGELASAVPAQWIAALGRAAAGHPRLAELLAEGPLEETQTALDNAPDVRRLYDEYLERFGDRCLEELKLESPTLREDPLPLLRAAGRAARPGRRHDRGGAVRLRAEQQAARALRRHPLRRLVFAWVLANARARIRGREELRFERTRVFGRVRWIVLELGRRFHALDLLDDPRDIFYLEIEEALGFVEGTACCTDLRGLAALRKAEYERFRAMPAPPGRFETRGPVLPGQSLPSAMPPAPPAGPRRHGTGCSPGRVRGRVRVIRDPRRETPQPGEILVAERTDPGWIVVFPGAAGLLVEHGSLLSHTAIVAREMGIPAVVALEGATSWLATGDRVDLDGASGEVVKL